MVGLPSVGSGLTKRGKWAYQAWAVGLPSVGSGLTKRGQWALVDADVAVTAAVYAGVSSAWHVTVAVIRLQLRRQALGTEAVHARDQSCSNRTHTTASNKCWWSAKFDTSCKVLHAKKNVSCAYPHTGSSTRHRSSDTSPVRGCLRHNGRATT